MSQQGTASYWQIDEDGYLISAAGTRCARIDRGVLYLYDKKTRSEVPFRLLDWALLMNSPRSTLGLMGDE